ncbi:putative membrane protein [Candidatus Ichthyocystis hellenicum]|uniref:Putative membrane protein n=1 Tax=Candidatus Ichthyocystis hellenicum TaxID=1561003 RepID=A0A0S4M206_9BURK|nr:hypothetical protein [Candidatus Ichthyocystis hellenicum]CUT17811.1 putative membrane protein [Candidatus Ichthyocystis hellenicum]
MEVISGNDDFLEMDNISVSSLQSDSSSGIDLSNSDSPLLGLVNERNLEVDDSYGFPRDDVSVTSMQSGSSLGIDLSEKAITLRPKNERHVSPPSDGIELRDLSMDRDTVVVEDRANDVSVGSRKITAVVVVCVVFVVLLWVLYAALMIASKNSVQYSHLMLAASAVSPVLTIIAVGIVATIVLRAVKSVKERKDKIDTDTGCLKRELEELRRAKSELELENCKLSEDISELRESLSKRPRSISSRFGSTEEVDGLVKLSEDVFSLRLKARKLGAELDDCHQRMDQAVVLMQGGDINGAKIILGS